MNFVTCVKTKTHDFYLHLSWKFRDLKTFSHSPCMLSHQAFPSPFSAHSFSCLLRYLYLCPSWEFKGGCRSTETLPLSPPGCWYLQTVSGIFLSDAFSLSPSRPHLCIFVNEKTCVVAVVVISYSEQQHLHLTVGGMMKWFVPLLLHSWSHSFKGYFCLHRAVMEGRCIGG